MAYEKVKRNRYYDPPSEYPHTSRHHAEDMQEFHRPLERMHNANLHDWGIARGLEVSGAIGGTEVVIKPGVALNQQGELIALSATGQGDIGNNPAGGQNNAVIVPVVLGLGSQAGKTVYVTIQFSEILRPAEGSGGRMEQLPWIRLQPVSGSEAYKDNGLSVILAIAEINTAGNLTALKAEDSTLDHGRRVIGQSLEELRIQQSIKVGNSVQETTSGKIGPGVGGGLKITVPTSGDNVSIDKEGGGNFSTLKMRANMLVAKDGAGRDALSLNTSTAALTVGTNGNEGDLSVKDGSGRDAFNVDGNLAKVTIGTNGNEGDLSVKDGSGRDAFNVDGNLAKVTIGTNGNEGELYLKNSSGASTIKLESEQAHLTLGGEGNKDGDLFVKKGTGEDTFNINGHEGDIYVRRKYGNDLREVLKFDASYAALYLGSKGNEGDLIVKNDSGNESIRLDGGPGNIKLHGQLRDGSNRNIGLNYTQKQDLTDGGISALHKHDIGNLGWNGVSATQIGVINGWVIIQSGYIPDGVEGSVTLRFSDGNQTGKTGIGYSSHHMHGYRGNFRATPNAILSPKELNLSTHDDTWFNFWYTIKSNSITINWDIDTYGGSHEVEFLIIGPK